MSARLYFSISLLLCTSFVANAQQFVEVSNNGFVQNNKPYFFIGANLWYGMNLGVDDSTGDRERLIRELDRMASLGITNLRIMGASEGPDKEPFRVVPSLQPQPDTYNEKVFEGLDFLLAQMKKRDMTAVVTLNNFWIWSGGMAQYLAWANHEKIPYSPPAIDGNWDTFQKYSSSFYDNKKANKIFKDFLKHIIKRKNTITGLAYENDPTIMAWQLGNEPRGYGNIDNYRKWIKKTAKYIQSKDKNHLVSIGTEGNTASHHAGTNFYKDHKTKYIDYATIHIWIENWSWYNPKNGGTDLDSAIYQAKKYLNAHLEMSEKLGKPLVLEEFGVARDMGSFDPESSTYNRDRFYKSMFKEIYELAEHNKGIAGCNFWSWSGEGRPVKAEALWQPNEPYTGDPPHEKQGWYSVYDKDSSTLEIISEYSRMMNGLNTSSELSFQKKVIKK